MRDAPVISAPPPPVAPIVIRGRGGPTAPFSVERIAHASVLIDFNGTRILTDPWFTKAPEDHHGEPLAVSAANLPKLAAIIVSHAHFDHFDVEHFAKSFPDKFVPMFVGFDDIIARAQRSGFKNVHKLAQGAHVLVGKVASRPSLVATRAGNHLPAEIGGQLSLLRRRHHALIGRDIAHAAPVDVAFLPANGLNVGGKSAVMSSGEAALTA